MTTHPPLAVWKQVVLSVIPHITGALSMVGSSCIAKEVIFDRKKRSTVYHRLLLGMSLCDVLTSFWMAMSTLPIPKGTPNVYAASGTTGTCTAQGFFILFGLATPLYNSSLAFYYLAVVRYGWRERRLRQVEYWMHGVPLVSGITMAFTGLALNLYNNANLWCWIGEEYQYQCSEEVIQENGGGDAECNRGSNAWIYRFALYFGPLWATIAIAIVAISLVYLAVQKQERAAKKYRAAHDASSRSRHSRQVATQALLYSVAFFVTWGPPTILRTLQADAKAGGQIEHGSWAFTLKLIVATCVPLQGFFNFLVYIRPRYLRYRRKHRDLSFFNIFFKAVRRTLSLRRQSQQISDVNLERQSKMLMSSSLFKTIGRNEW